LLGLGPKAKQPVTSITPQHIENFLNERLEAGMAPKTAIVDLKTFSTAFRRAEAYSIILKNPVAADTSPFPALRGPDHPLDRRPADLVAQDCTPQPPSFPHPVRLIPSTRLFRNPPTVFIHPKISSTRLRTF
jgi:hypothetical protein